MRRVEPGALWLIFALATCTLPGCTEDELPPGVAEHGPSETSETLQGEARTRGHLLRATRLRTLSVADVKAELRAEDFATGQVLNGVTLYQLVYTTIDPNGAPISASGLYVEPRTNNLTLALVSYAHGTELFKGDAPSFGEDGFLTGPAVTMAAAGFAAVAPDYLGLGTGPGVHPYMHLPTEVSASLDLMRAARTFAREHERLLEREVLVTGFSQGSFAAIGLARELADRGDDWFRLGALAPISGPYDTRNWIREAIDGDDISPKDATMYLAYMSVSYDRLYGLYDQPSDFFRPPYDTIESLLDNTHEGPELALNTPGTPRELLTEQAVERYLDPDPVLAAPLDELARVCTGWSTRVPVKLFAARADEQVPFENSSVCQRKLKAAGISAGLTDLGEHSHLESSVVGAGAVVKFFRFIQL